MTRADVTSEIISKETFTQSFFKRLKEIKTEHFE